MKIYVGVTDGDWFGQLSSQRPDEVNFWKPGGNTPFRALEPGGLFLFKLHQPRNFVVGGAHFVSFSALPSSLARKAFREKNGVRSLDALLQRVRRYRNEPTADPDPTIGCVILNQPFWFSESEWIPVPSNWPMNTVQGKTYDAFEEHGRARYRAVQERLSGAAPLLVAE